MKESIIKLMVWFRIVKLSSGWTFRINLSDKIYYNNHIYSVANGIRCGMWRLYDLNNDNDGWVKRSECRKVWTIKNCIGSFKCGYRFYMGYWYDIWVKEKLNKCSGGSCYFYDETKI